MQKATDYLEKNKASWNKRTEFHVKSDFYQNEAFINGANSLQSIELALLGDIKGKSVLHLQCHFGQDTLSMARMGAQTTGVDLSDKAIDEAKKLNTKLGLSAEFVCCDIYDLPNHLDKQFDIVFTSYGTIAWLPDIDKWAAIVSKYLKPGGQFIFAEFHPFVWMFDDDFTKIQHPYFKADPIVEMESGTYADKSAAITMECVTWNHSLSSVMTNLIKHDIEIADFQEYNYSPYNCFSQTEKIGDKQFRIKHLADKIPMVYSIVGRKR